MASKGKGLKSGKGEGGGKGGKGQTRAPYGPRVSQSAKENLAKGFKKGKQ